MELCRETSIETLIAGKDDPKNAFFEILTNKSDLVLLGIPLHHTGNSTRSMGTASTKPKTRFGNITPS